MDPLVGAVCDPKEIRQMVDEYLVEQRQWLPQYEKSIKEAEARLSAAKADGSFITTKRDYKGAARLKTKSIDEIRAAKENA